MNRRIWKINLRYPIITVWRSPGNRQPKRYGASNASWERLRAALNARLRDVGIEVSEITRAEILL